MMCGMIKWHETAKELPQPVELTNGKTKWTVNEPLLVIWENKVKPSEYDAKTNTWLGHTDQEVPAYWVKLKEIEIMEIFEKE